MDIIIDLFLFAWSMPMILDVTAVTLAVLVIGLIYRWIGGRRYVA